jgi:hypothetical protein
MHICTYETILTGTGTQDTFRSFDISKFLFADSAITQAVSRLLFTAEARVRAQDSRRETCGRQRGTGTGPSVLPGQYHSTAAPFHSCVIWEMDEGPDSGPVTRT